MATEDINKRTAGFKRPNAMAERMRRKGGVFSQPLTRPDPLAVADEPRGSLVLLLRDRWTPTEADLRAAVQRAFGVAPPARDYGAAEHIVHAGPLGTIRIRGWTLDTEAGDSPYFAEVETTTRWIPELRLRAAVQDHRAWLRVDLSDFPLMSSEEDRLAQVGKLVAALAPDNTGALFRPATGQLGLYTSEAAARLARGDVTEAFRPTDKPVPIAGIEEGDPRMAEAEAEANRRFGEFLAAFANRKPGQTFAVKVPFEDENGVEFMWVTVTQVNGSHIDGQLDNEPAFVRSVRHGQAVRVLRETLNDWLYTQGNELRGGFTLKVLGNQLKSAKPTNEDAA